MGLTDLRQTAKNIKRENNYRLGQEKYKPTTDIDRSTFQKEHRQPKRTMSGFGLQRSFGRNTLQIISALSDAK